jgi:hypothetical protein
MNVGIEQVQNFNGNQKGKKMNWNDYDEPLVYDLGFITCMCVLSFLCGIIIWEIL